LSCLSDLLPGPSAANKKAASDFGRLAVVLSMNMTGQGRVKRAHHQLPMFIEFVMRRMVAAVSHSGKRLLLDCLPFMLEKIKQPLVGWRVHLGLLRRSGG
jgi:hypothetical protein